MAESNNLNPEENRPASPASEVGGEEAPAEEELSEQEQAIAALSQSRRDFLDRALQVLQQYSPQPAALGDLPQISVAPELIAEVCRDAKQSAELNCQMLLCMSCVDYQEYLQMVYVLHSLKLEQTLVIKVRLSYEQPSIPTLTTVWPAADWYEREAHDLFGVDFPGHPDLAPLLLYDEFEGYPGRKEFPFYEYQEF